MYNKSEIIGNNQNNLAEYLFHEGTNYKSYDYFGSFLNEDECIFRVWAPNAKEVYVTGDFCNWEEKKYRATKISEGGIYECRISGVKKYDCYKYVFVTQDNRIIYKSDPYAIHFETRPYTSSKIYKMNDFEWSDEEWLKNRQVPYNKPLNIYEVHLGSWKIKEDGSFYNYREIADELVVYVKKMGYTHVEFLPILEHPYDKSWGYQVIGYFAPTSRYGVCEDFMYLVNLLHINGIGVILDWVPGHFPKDEAGLCEFDGGYTYEYSDPRMMEHKEWGTRVFDYGKNEVKSFLISNASYWLDRFHIDGLRVDAVSSMLYLDYGREEWTPNKYGGNENLEVIEFFKSLNTYISDTYKGVMMIAEESTAWPKVTHPISEGGLGFNFKWNMGWMNDSLSYISTDPFFRKGIHSKMTFSMTYAFSEKYILPLSHDEVVHGKKSILDKCDVDFDSKFHNMRAFLAYMYAHPGKKLTFMGIDISQVIEWDESKEIDWFLLEYPKHKMNNRFISELNKVYKDNPPFWENDNCWEGFKWNIVDDSNNNVFAFTRKSSKSEILVVSNFSSQELKKYKIGVDKKQSYKILFNTDSKKYGGNGYQNRNLSSVKGEWGGFDYTLELKLPPFSTMYLVKK